MNRNMLSNSLIIEIKDFFYLLIKKYGLNANFKNNL